MRGKSDDGPLNTTHHEKLREKKNFNLDIYLREREGVWSFESRQRGEFIILLFLNFNLTSSLFFKYIN